MNMSTAIDVLVVDDCDSDAELTMLALRREVSADRLLRLKDGEQALNFVFRSQAFSDRAPGLPRLILLDLETPIVGGLKMLETLHEDPEASNIPTVVLSSSSNPLAIERSYELGARDYIVKPRDFTGYCAEVERVVEEWCPVREMAH